MTGGSRSPRTFALDERATLWHTRADEIRDKILTQAWSDKRQAFAERFGGHELDASVLLMAEVGLIDPRALRFVATVDALRTRCAMDRTCGVMKAPMTSSCPRRRSTSAPSRASMR